MGTCKGAINFACRKEGVRVRPLIVELLKIVCVMSRQIISWGVHI